MNLRQGFAVLFERMVPQLAIQHDAGDAHNDQYDERRDFMKPVGFALASSFFGHRPLAPVKMAFTGRY
jgi:hypothetical protein